MSLFTTVAAWPSTAQMSRATAALVVVATCGSARTQEAPPRPSSPAQPVEAETPAGEKLQRVEVTGTRNVTNQRRYSTAAKIVIGREEIEQFGDMTLADVMKRPPRPARAPSPAPSIKSNSDTVLDETGSDMATVLDQRSATTIDDRSWSLNAKLFPTLNDAHSLTAGLEAEGVNRTENALTFINGAPSLPSFGGDIAASTLRLAAFAQDEWTVSPTVAANAGLRWESIRTRSASYGDPVRNDSIVLTPLSHAVRYFDEAARDQARFSLTRGYRAPTLQNIIAVPTLSTLYPAPGFNTASSPDKAGNPGRRPELATGIDLALEHYLSRSGVISISVFKRNIRDLIRNVTSLETVPWAVAQRWVTRPQNTGDATTHGVAFDAKFQLDALMDGAPPLTLRTSLGVHGSSVSGVPGPYNRIDQQPRASANVGGDYKFRSLPLTMGGNFSWVPPYTVQDTAIQSQGYDLTRVIDAYGPWTIDKTTKIRLSLSNIVPRNCIPTNTIVGNGQSQLVTANGPTYRVVGLRLEMKLQGLRHRPTTNCVGGRPAIARALATLKTCETPRGVA